MAALMSKNKFPPKRRTRPAQTEDGPVFLYGLHTVRAALLNTGRRKLRLLATPNALNRLTEDGARDFGTETDLQKALSALEPQTVTPRDLDNLLGRDAVHQGIALEVDPVDRPRLGEARKLNLVVVLDQVTDPHNVGAILRTACAFGADAVITTARYAPRETGVLAKSASGALDLVPLIEVQNLAEAIVTLKKAGMVCLGFDSEAEEPLGLRNTERLAIVLGAEGKGLRQKTRQLCDEMVRLEMPGPIKSLNVSNAAAIALFAATAGSA